VIVLALDTTLDACQCALVSEGEALAVVSEPMVRGHQERLAGMVAEGMAQARLDFAAIDQLAVTVGPGSFTGLRVGLAFAKGLAMALSRPLAGVGTLEAFCGGAAGLSAAVIDAGRGRIYLQVFEGGAALDEPRILLLDEGAARLHELAAGRKGVLAGPGAHWLADAFPNFTLTPLAAPDPCVIAALALGARPPTPLYLRPPDARPRRP
jgi:tRNA threonylcarbamoyladenosine biosynthesis protein TsaB